MPFESLSERIQMSLRRLTGRGKLNEKDIDEAMREIRVSLLEADVNYKIVKQFITDVKEKAVGERVLKSLTPGDQVVKIVYEELVKGQKVDQAGVPESFRVLIKEFQALGLDISVLNSEGEFVDMKELEKEEDDTYLSADEFENSEEVPEPDEAPVEEDEEEEEEVDFDDLEPDAEDLENVFGEGDE